MRGIAYCIVGLALCIGAAFSAEVQWQPLDIQRALAKAGAEGKLVYVFVEGDNCPPCDAFKASHLSDPAYIDFVNTVYVPIRVHTGDPAGAEFLESLRLTHAAVPRFYVLAPDGSGVSMSIGIVAAPPMNPAEVLKLAMGRELPVSRENAAGLASRIRAHAASQRAAGALYADNPLRHIGVAILEAEAWALAGRYDEAERAFGPEWPGQLVSQEIRDWYVNFWLAANRNLAGALAAAQAYVDANSDDPNGNWLMGRALAANGRYAEAVRQGEIAVRFDPENHRVAALVDEWRARAQ